MIYPSYDDVDLAERARERRSLHAAREDARAFLKRISDGIIDEVVDLHLGEDRAAAVDRVIERLAELRHWARTLDALDTEVAKQ